MLIGCLNQYTKIDEIKGEGKAKETIKKEENQRIIRIKKKIKKGFDLQLGRTSSKGEIEIDN